MKAGAATAIAANIKAAVNNLSDVVEFMRQNLEFSERAPFNRAIGEIFALISEEIESRLVVANPELHDEFFREFPKSYPEQLLRTSRYRKSSE